MHASSGKAPRVRRAQLAGALRLARMGLRGEQAMQPSAHSPCSLLTHAVCPRRGPALSAWKGAERPMCREEGPCPRMHCRPAHAGHAVLC